MTKYQKMILTGTFKLMQIAVTQMFARYSVNFILIQ